MRIYKNKKIEYEVNENGCHICTSHCKSSSGYPVIRIKGKQYYISHIIYERAYGIIPEGLILRHTCDTPACINPEHLLIGTHKDNARDRDERGRRKNINREGRNNGRVKLTENQVIEIRDNKTQSQVKLAEIYTISETQISYIKNRKTWRHI